MMAPKSKLVDVRDFGIKGINYYFERKEQFGISAGELAAIGVDNSVLVNQAIIPALQKVQSELKQQGYDLIVKDAYRSPELYKLVKRKRYERDGKENTDKTLDAVNMPHADGYTVDVNLLDLATGSEMELRDKSDWPNGIFVDFYKDRADAKSQKYQKLQTILIKTMLKNGFRLAGLREFWHFTYDEGAK